MSTVESQVIGAILYTGPEAFSECFSSGIRADHFTGDYKRAFQLCRELFEKGRAIDSVSVKRHSELKKSPIPDSVLLGAIDSCTHPGKPAMYFEALFEEYDRRRIAFLCGKQYDDWGTGHIEEPQKVIHQVIKQWSTLSRSHAATKTVLEEAEEMINGWQNPKSGEFHIAWPMDKLNNEIPPVTDELIYIAAKESVGKTAFVLQWAGNLAQGGTRVSIASLESSRKKVLMRLISCMGKIDTLHMRKRDAFPEDYDRAREVATDIADLPMEIVTGAFGVPELRAWAMREKNRGSRMLFVDNMRHIRPEKQGMNPVEHFRDLSLKIKWIRDDVGLPIVILHHLNEAEDVSWSKDIKRDADVLIFMIENEKETILPSHENNFLGRRVIDFQIRKNRDGARGFRLRTIFDQRHQRFDDFE